MDIFAAISSVDPPSLVAWLVLAFAAALYPVGLMLGSGCSPCCSCGPAFYSRCLRQECVSCTPKSGVSTSIGQVESAGVDSVCTVRTISIAVTGSSFIHLSGGESLALTITQPSAGVPATLTPLNGGDDIQGQFALSIIGVDVPLVPPRSDDLYANTPSGQPSSREIVFGDSSGPRASVSAAVSIHVRGVSVQQGSQWLPPAFATESALLPMLTWTPPQHTGGIENPLAGNEFATTFAFSPPAALTEYVPPNWGFRFFYTVEFRRGAASVFRTLEAWATKPGGQAQSELPEGGFPPLNIPTPNFTDTPNTQTQPVIQGNAITIWSNSAKQARTPTYSFRPQGIELFPFKLPALTVTPILPVNYTSTVTRNLDCLERRNVFDPFFMDGFQMLAGNTFVNAPYVFDHDEVDRYVRGERCFDVTDPRDGTVTKWCVEPWNVLCGLGLCARPWLLPQTATANVQVYAASCGVFVPVIGRLDHDTSLLNGSPRLCSYRGRFSWVESSSGGKASEIRIRAARFFPGDLLYSLENGPVSLIALVPGDFPAGVPTAPGVASIGGSLPAGKAAVGFYRCSASCGGSAAVKCLPSSVSVTAASLSLGPLVSKIPSHLSDYQLDKLRSAAEQAVQNLSGASATASRIGSESCTTQQYGGSGSNFSVSASAAYDSCGNVVVSGGGESAFHIDSENKINASTTQAWAIAGFAEQSGIAQWTVNVTSPSSASATPVSGTLEYGTETSATTGLLVSGTISVSPSSVPWTGGQVSWSISPASAAGGGASSGTATIPARTDYTPGEKQILVGPPDSLYVAVVSQEQRPCAIEGIRFFVQEAITSRRGRVRAEVSLPCSVEYTATPDVNWITVEFSADRSVFCLRIESNDTGSQRVGKVAISPVWIAPPSNTGTGGTGQPGGNVTNQTGTGNISGGAPPPPPPPPPPTATVGTYEYVIEQPG